MEPTRGEIVTEQSDIARMPRKPTVPLKPKDIATFPGILKDDHLKQHSEIHNKQCIDILSYGRARISQLLDDKSLGREEFLSRLIEIVLEMRTAMSVSGSREDAIRLAEWSLNTISELLRVSAGDLLMGTGERLGIFHELAVDESKSAMDYVRTLWGHRFFKGKGRPPKHTDKITSSKLGKEIGIAESYIRELLQGVEDNPTVRVYNKLVRALGGSLIIRKGSR